MSARSTLLVATLLAATLLATLLSPPPAAAQAAQNVLIDPEGDAYDVTPAMVGWTASGACILAGAPRETCQQAQAAPSPDVGTPSSPAVDIVAVDLSETPRDLLIDLKVSRLEEGFGDALPRDGGSAGWLACWSADWNGTVFDCVYGFASRIGGRIQVAGYYYRGGEDCGDMRICIHVIPFTPRPGSPGTLTWTVPRAALTDGGLGGRVEGLRAVADTSDSPFGYLEWSAVTPLRTPEGSTYGTVMHGDAASGSKPYTFQTPLGVTFAEAAFSRVRDEDGDAWNVDGRADADVLGMSISENETTLIFEVEVARLNASDVGRTIGAIFGLSSGPTFWLSFDEQGPAVAMCGDVGCSYNVQAPARVEVVEGEPGQLRLHVDRALFGFPPAGTRVSAAWGFSQVTSEQSQRPVPAAEVEVTQLLPGDFVGGSVWGPAYELRLDGVRPPASASEPSTGALLRDAAGDTVSRPDVDTGAPMYDLVLAAVEGTSPTSTRVTIGVEDLSRVSVPAGWKAVVYSVSIETDAGATIVGYYRDAGRGDFFCAADTLIATEEVRDPAESAWTLLEGALSVASSTTTVAGGSGGGSPSTLTIFVPHACFGTDVPGVIPARAVVAAVHLVPQSLVQGVPVQEIMLVDEARDDDLTAFSLGAPLVPDAPWWARSFWDIFGIAVGVALSGIGLFAVRRKRGIMQRYLSQIDRVIAAHPEGSKAREAGLLDIRTRLRHDLVHGRIVEAHYLVVEHRLNDHLAQLRMRTLTDTFGDLPHRLLEKLLDVLADGTITREEARRFTALLEDSSLTEEGRERIRRKLDLWVVEDAQGA